MRTTPIFLIEDNPDDSEAIMRGLRKAGIKNKIEWFSGSAQALEALEALPEDHDQTPCMIILDLNMPGMDGRNVITALKQKGGLRHIPIVVLTTSADKNDVYECYEKGANSYIQKPVSFKKLTETTQYIKDYWFETALLPRDEHA